MKTIIAALDLSESTRRILDAAVDVARAYCAHLYIIHVAAPDPDFVGYEAGPQSERDAVAAHYHREHRELGGFADEVRQQGIDATALLVQGATVEKLVLECKRLQADLIVAGSHGRGAMYQLVVGSTSDGLIREAGCPVMIIPCREAGG